MTKRSAILTFLVLALAAESALLGFLALRARWQSTAGATPVQRGRKVAERMGCFACHGPGGERGIPNPGAQGETVPEWSGGTWMMWNDKEEDTRAWILDGHPPGRKPDEAALLRMPAYRGLLSEPDLADLTAYVQTVSAAGGPDDPKEIEGMNRAQALGCFGCHGPEGRGLIENPRSFKGYVPPWDGDDFAELVANEAELRQWVRNGTSDRMKQNPAASVFLKRQPIKMPAFGQKATDADLAALWAYVQWVRTHPRTGVAGAGPNAG